MTCPNCGIEYDDFRTGLTFREVRRMMFTGAADPCDWRHKRRRSVLGFWHELKTQLWQYHVNMESKP